MAEFDIPCTTSYQSTIVCTAISCTIFELSDVDCCRHLFYVCDGHLCRVAVYHDERSTHLLLPTKQLSDA